MIASSPTRPSIQSADRYRNDAPIYLGSLALSNRESLSVRQYLSQHISPRSQRLSSLGLDTRDLAILHSVADCRLITANQLQRLHFTDHNSHDSATRACRRVLFRLARKKVITRGKRRIGGVRKGSSSYVYSIGTLGVKLLETEGQNLRPYSTNPSDYFFEHTLGLSDLYTQIHELALSSKIHLLEIQTEPKCWRQLGFANKKLRPDMFVRIAKTEEEFLYFIELDRGTTHLPSILRKLQQYIQYYNSGVEQDSNGVFPQVLWVVPDSKRRYVIKMVVETLPVHFDRLFEVLTVDDALHFICGRST